MKEEKHLTFSLRDDWVPLMWTGAEAWKQPQFVPYVGEDGRPEWKCAELDMTLRAQDHEWGVFNASGELVMRPFGLAGGGLSRPPEGIWVAIRRSPVNDMPFIYDVTGEVLARLDSPSGK